MLQKHAHSTLGYTRDWPKMSLYSVHYYSGPLSGYVDLYCYLVSAKWLLHRGGLLLGWPLGGFPL